MKARQSTLSPRKKASQERSIMTVDAIVEAAARILETRGAEGYTTNVIAERAGVSVGSLYQYFPNKDSITNALIERETTILIGRVRSAAGESDARLALSVMIRLAVAHQFERPILARLLDAEEVRLLGSAHESRFAELARSAIAPVVKRVTCAQVEDAESAALDIMAITRGLTDAISVQGDVRTHGVEQRISRAVFGYLGLACGQRRFPL
ncbi:TetR/AcrR family transcriptional regulator [Dyella sp. A6]|uniref:TetR/AcrR family transcriptional regulator n=1 Tax=Dyella aluminiiresistens TaxID=3069105 RepID=UPI002E771415|nr:TetR/AcrR family transcriptional regulator [Dyella sp. A6]